MKITGHCKTPWALNKGAPLVIFRPETDEERNLVVKNKIQKIIDSLGFPANYCHLPAYESAKLKDGTVKLKQRQKHPTQVTFGYGNENEAWELFWRSIPG